VKQGEVDSAIRRALNLFDAWVDATDAIPKHTSLYYEIQGCIEDAVHCGIQQALNNFKELESEVQR
jgi:hypothetical protein